MLRSVLLFLVVTAMPALAGGKLPDWTRGAVWYQILPERFRNINPQNDPVREDVVSDKIHDWQVHPWASDWYKMQIWEQSRNLPIADLLKQRRYGGDLIGVVEKLPYLKAIGVTVIYLTPVFESPSVEKYDIATWHHIDNNFGVDRDKDLEAIRGETEDPASWTLTKSDEVFIELLSQAHELEMKVVIETVFNYCSDEFWAFADVKEKQKDSKYADWFEVLAWDDPATPDVVEFAYQSWQDDNSRPVFSKDSTGSLIAPIEAYLLAATRRWMDADGDGDTSDGVDGWLVKNVSELPESFWSKWREQIRSANADAIAVADEAGGGDAFDLHFNREQSQFLIEFFVNNDNKIGPSDFSKKLAELRALTSDELNQAMLVQLSSHQTDRLATVIVNSRPALANGASAENGHHLYNPCKPDSAQRRLQNLATFFQLTYPGAPVIYYGDESGMWGGNYPDNIKPMLWKEFLYERETYTTLRPDLGKVSDNVVERELLMLHRGLNLTKLKCPALTVGDYREIIVDDEKKIFAFSRKHDNNEVLVFLNLGGEKQSVEYNPGWRKNLKLKDPLSEEKFRLDGYNIKIEMEPMSGRVLVKEK